MLSNFVFKFCCRGDRLPRYVGQCESVFRIEQNRTEHNLYHLHKPQNQFMRKSVYSNSKHAIAREKDPVVYQLKYFTSVSHLLITCTCISIGKLKY